MESRHGGELSLLCSYLGFVSLEHKEVKCLLQGHTANE